MKVFWKIIYRWVARFLPCSDSKISFGAKRLRRLCAKHIIAYCGEDVNIEHGALFGDNVSIGSRSGIGINAKLYGEIVIGENVLMGPECILISTCHEFSRIDIPIIDQGFRDIEKIEIEDDVWLGARVIVLPGVKVGKGVVVGAGSVVTKDIPDYSIVAGVPAKIIKSRKSEQ